MGGDTVMKMALSRVHYPVTALGYGRRLGIWLQGCPLACPGCISRDTWVADERHDTTLTETIAACDALVSGLIDGVTISGGEPFQQPDALEGLLSHWATRRSRQTAP